MNLEWELAAKKGDVREVERRGDDREAEKGEIRAGQKRGDTRELKGRQRWNKTQKGPVEGAFFFFFPSPQSAKVGW